MRFRAEGAPIGEVFSFTSGLYFRGKLTYALAYGRALVITADRGLVAVDTVIGPRDVEAFCAVDIDPGEPRYVAPLQRDARLLTGPVVLLGSLATPKYTGPLSEVLGDHLLYPPDFVGQGDMRRGSILLKRARDGQELEYEAWKAREKPAGRPITA